LFSSEYISRLREVPLETVLDASSSTKDSYDQRKWETIRGVISITGTKFYNWNLSCGGGGAIDLARHLLLADFHKACKWLSTLCLGNEKWNEQRNPKILLMPVEAPEYLLQTIRYLCCVRKIPLSAINQLIYRKVLYADKRRNAVFLLLGKEKGIVGAELRGTSKQVYHGMATGSKKEKGFFYAGPEDSKKVILCEAAIDAVSCSVINPDAVCISAAGIPTTTAWLQTLITRGLDVYCGYDNDPRGEKAAHSMLALYQSVKRLRPTTKDWNLQLQ
jgi:hypothetical protein